MANLAIHGGEKVNPEGHVPWPVVTEQDRKMVIDVLDSGTFWGHHAPQVMALQQEFAQYLGIKHCQTTAAGTAALHIAVAAAGIGPGDEVITTALTFVATAHCILQQNAVPIFVDIDPQTYNIDPKRIEEKITRRTKAIIPVHLHGLPAEMDEINAIAEKHGLVVIEDACQAHGATYKGRKAGTLGHMAAFSLNGSKNLPGCEGGLFVTDNDRFAYKANIVRGLGEDIQEDIERDYNAFEIGWMYRYTEMPAAFTRSRLKSLDEDNEIRRKNAAYLNKAFSKMDGLTPPDVPDDRTSVYHLYRVRIDPKELGITEVSPKTFRAKVQKALRAEGITANRWQNRPVPSQRLFVERRGYGKGCPWSCPYREDDPFFYDPADFPVTQALVDDSIVFHDPLYPPNGEQVMQRYVEAFQKLWDNLDEVLAVQFEQGEIYIRD